MSSKKQQPKTDLFTEYSNKFSEEAFKKKFDKCSTDGTVKGVGGLILGTIISACFFRLKLWPIAYCIGFGLGSAFRNCQIEFEKDDKKK